MMTLWFVLMKFSEILLHQKVYPGMRVRDFNFPGKICRIFCTSNKKVPSAVGDLQGGGAVNSPKRIQEQSSWKLELYSSLTGSKQPRRVGKTNTLASWKTAYPAKANPRCFALATVICENGMLSQYIWHYCFIIYRTVERDQEILAELFVVCVTILRSWRLKG